MSCFCDRCGDIVRSKDDWRDYERMCETCKLHCDGLKKEHEDTVTWREKIARFHKTEAIVLNGSKPKYLCNSCNREVEKGQKVCSDCAEVKA